MHKSGSRLRRCAAVVPVADRCVHDAHHVDLDGEHGEQHVARVEIVNLGTIQRRPSRPHSTSGPTPKPVTVSTTDRESADVRTSPGAAGGSPGPEAVVITTGDVVAGYSAMGGRVSSVPAESERSTRSRAVSSSRRSTVRDWFAMEVHARTPFVDARYERWLDLFVSTVDETFVGNNAERAKHRSTTMAQRCASS